jgi:hypothetical protein
MKPLKNAETIQPGAAIKLVTASAAESDDKDQHQACGV